MASNDPTTASTTTKETPRAHPKARHTDIARWAAYFFLLLGAAVALIPFLYTVSVSLMNLTEATGGAFLPKTPQWQNYSQAWNDAKFSLYFWNTVKVTVITVTGQVTFCTLAALNLSLIFFA